VAFKIAVDCRGHSHQLYTVSQKSSHL